MSKTTKAASVARAAFVDVAIGRLRMPPYGVSSWTIVAERSRAVRRLIGRVTRLAEAPLHAHVPCLPNASSAGEVKAGVAWADNMT
jgi:hypothetical protein